LWSSCTGGTRTKGTYTQLTRYRIYDHRQRGGVCRKIRRGDAGDKGLRLVAITYTDQIRIISLALVADVNIIIAGGYVISRKVTEGRVSISADVVQTEIADSNVK
jgi:hypothetical protein